VLAAAAASVLFVAAGLRSRVTFAGSAFAAPDAPTRQRNNDYAFAGGDPAEDVATAVYVALARLAPLVSRQAIKIDLALRPRLKAGMPAGMLADTIEDLLAAAINAAPASQLLVTAARHGDRIDISVTDDIPNGDQAIRLGRVRHLTERVALRGDALIVDVRPRDGTTMTLRLARVAEPATAKAACPMDTQDAAAPPV
jgi:hypothetical protein